MLKTAKIPTKVSAKIPPKARNGVNHAAKQPAIRPKLETEVQNESSKKKKGYSESLVSRFSVQQAGDTRIKYPSLRQTVISKPMANITTSSMKRKEDLIIQNSTNKREAGSSLESSINASKGSGSSLSKDTRGFMESRFCTDFSGVKVHTDNQAVQMNKELNSQAFAHGMEPLSEDDVQFIILKGVDAYPDTSSLQKIIRKDPEIYENDKSKLVIATYAIKTYAKQRVQLYESLKKGLASKEYQQILKKINKELHDKLIKLGLPVSVPLVNNKVEEQINKIVRNIYKVQVEALKKQQELVRKIRKTITNLLKQVPKKESLTELALRKRYGGKAPLVEYGGVFSFYLVVLRRQITEAGIYTKEVDNWFITLENIVKNFPNKVEKIRDKLNNLPISSR